MGWFDYRDTGEDEILEDFKVTFPHLNKLMNIELVDPRIDTDGRKVLYSREGQLFKNEKVYDGTYIVYNDVELPKKHIGVFISDNVNEEDGEKPITVLALDSDKQKTINRVGYQIRKSKNKIAELD